MPTETLPTAERDSKLSTLREDFLDAVAFLQPVVWMIVHCAVHFVYGLIVLLAGNWTAANVLHWQVPMLDVVQAAAIILFMEAALYWMTGIIRHGLETTWQHRAIAKYNWQRSRSRVVPFAHRNLTAETLSQTTRPGGDQNIRRLYEDTQN